ncbi:hypothetical protein GALMADRAFT_280288 [Galerina marginata CBS 339.88]|uniref:Uncharacterized protein n=1 Tax=Galerina marginata (strain CBS 339.88) TaxID=685588 RepID=A0A067STJ4_GALM3|nr:hypothetical protein GALMADRAFT_280288 [Galerina marginata CBS 339.88]
MELAYLLLLTNGMFSEHVLQKLQHFNLGRKLNGGASSLVAVPKHLSDTYKAEQSFDEACRNFPDFQHIDFSTAEISPARGRWLHWLIITSLLSVILSILPYVYLIIQARDIGASILWPILSPVIRSTGSLIITVSSQFILRSRIMVLINRRIVFYEAERKARELQVSGQIPGIFVTHQPRPRIELVWDSLGPSWAGSGQPNSHQEKESQANVDWTPVDSTTRRRRCLWYRAKGVSVGHKDALTEYIRQLKNQHALFASDWRRYQGVISFSLFVGLVFTIFGFLGCSLLVQSADVDSLAPFVWFMAETALSSLRTLIWISDPKFDEKNNFIIVSYQDPSDSFRRLERKMTWGLLDMELPEVDLT